MADELEVMQRRLERQKQARKAAEKLLEEKSREIFEANQKLSKVALFAELSPNPILRFDYNGLLLLANRAAREVFGAEVVEGNGIEYLLPQFKDINLSAIIDEDEIFQASASIGASCYQIVINGVSDYGFVNVYASDITQQELAKKQIEHAHRETEQMLSAISSILVGVDRDGKITRWNEAAVEAFGLSSSTVLGRLFSDCNIPWKLDIGSFLADSGAGPKADFMPEIVYTTVAGKEGYLNVHVNTVNDSNGAFNGFLLLARDITKRKEMEGQLMQAQKLESLGQLAAGIAHEINTPIQFIGDNTRFLEVAFQRLDSVINGARALLKEVTGGTGMLSQVISDLETSISKAKLDYMTEEIPFAIEETLGGVDQVASIVKAMKQFSHPGSKEKVLANLNESVKSTINVARNEWKYVADMEVDLSPDLPEVPCLLSELNQVVLNMIVNAAHAIEEKYKGSSDKGTIRIRTLINEGYAEIHIQDDGAGIPDHVVPKIFDPFYTTKDVGKGSGQGLSIAYNVIFEKHKGTIKVDTEAGEGTTFIVRLPLEEVEAEVRV